MIYYPFDSRKNLYKSKFGAVESGESLTLRLILHNDAKVFEAFLRYTNDSESEIHEVKLTPGDYLEDYRIYYCDISFNTGLYFYSFRYTSAYGEFFVGNWARIIAPKTNAHPHSSRMVST